MPRFHSMCLVALLLLNTVTCAFAESNEEHVRLLAGDKDAKTLTVSNRDGAKKSESFIYGDGIKFTAVYPASCLQKQEDVIRFNLMLGDCNLSFLWSFHLLEFEGVTLHENYVDHREKDVPVEITNLVRMNGVKKGSTHCTNGLKKDSKVNVTVSSGSGCRGLSLVFDNEVCKDIKPPSPPSGSRSRGNEKAKEGQNDTGNGLSTTALALIIAGSIALLVLVVIGAVVFIYFCCDREYSSSSSSSSGRSHRAKGCPMSSVRSSAVSDKTKERQSQAETSGIEDSRKTEKIAALENAQVFDDVIKSFQEKSEPKKVNDKKPEPKKLTAKKPEPKKVNDKKAEPKKVNDKKAEPKKVNDKKPEPKKVIDKKLEPKKVNDKKPEPKKSTEKKPEPKVNDKKPEPKKSNEKKPVPAKEEVGKQTKDKDIKPKFIALDSKRKLIAEGARRGEDSYPTMEDLDSDWGDADGKDANRKKKHKK